MKKSIQEDDYHHQSTMPNNILQKLPPSDLANKAVMSFKCENFRDFINNEEFVDLDISDVDEKVNENEIIPNIKQLIMTFGRDFSFVGNQISTTLMRFV